MEKESLAGAQASISVSEAQALRAFPAEAAADGYYPEPSRVQCLNLLLQLVPYTNEVAVVAGPEGSGKSALLAQFSAQRADSWLLVSVSGAALDGMAALAEHLNRGFGFGAAPGVSPEQLLAVVLHRCNELHDQGRHPIVVIDDAHLAAAAVWNLLSALAQAIKQSGSHLSLLLAVEPAFWDTPPAKPLIRAGAYRLDLGPVDDQEEVKYIRHRLAFAQLPADALSAADVNMIVRASGGNLADINALARQRLLRLEGEFMPVTRKPAPLSGPRPPRLPMLLAGAMVATAVVSAVLLRDRLVQWWMGAPDFGRAAPAVHEPRPGTRPAASEHAPPAPMAETQPPPTAPALPELVMPDLGVAPERAGEVSAPQAAAPPSPAEELAVVTPKGPEIEPSPPVPAAEAVVPGVPPSVPAAPPEAPAAASIAAPLPASEHPAASGPAPPALPPLATATAPASTERVPWPAREDWLMAQPASAYTLQLMALSSEAGLHKVLAPIKDPTHFAYFRLRRDGVYYYALVYGTYPTIAAAQQAAGTLPKELGKVQPWVRKYKAIQDDIRALRPESGGAGP